MVSQNFDANCDDSFCILGKIPIPKKSQEILDDAMNYFCEAEDSSEAAPVKIYSDDGGYVTITKSKDFPMRYSFEFKELSQDVS